MLINFSTKKALILDDMSTMRVAIKSMLLAIGVEDIDTATNGNDALNLMRKNRYDIVICDYNLGEGKNGQQVLEEAKHDELAGYSTIFFMITAENTMNMVMGAVEYRPDDYLTKPINKDILKTRLVNAIKKKSDLESLDKLVSNGLYDKALLLINHYIEAKPDYLSDLLRMKAEIALNFDDLDTAEEVYLSVISRRRLSWALTGLARIRNLRKEYEQSIEMLSEVIEEDPVYMEAYDLLADSYHAVNNNEAAQECLLKAVSISPISIQRQMSLGEIALETGAAAVAEKAYRSAIGIGRHSIFKNPENYTKLAKTLASNGSARDAIRTLKNMRADYPGDNIIALQSAVTESQVYETLELEGGVKTARETASELFSRIKSPLPTDVAMGFAEMEMAAGNNDNAMSALGSLARNNYEDSGIIDNINELIKKAGLGDESLAVIERARKEIKELNNQAVKLFREGKILESMEIFRSLSDKASSNRTINMNAARIHLEAAKKDIDKEVSLGFIRTCLGRISDTKQDKEKYRKMMTEYQQLIA